MGLNAEQDKDAKTSSIQGVKVISRAADILRTLRDDNTGLSLGQIAERVTLPRSTVQRIINALLKEHLVMMASAEGGLRLGPEIQSLATAGRIDVAEMARPILAELSRQTGETADLGVFKDSHMVFVDQVQGSLRLRAVSAVGDTFPMSVTANGKAALALLSDEIVASIVAKEMRDNDVIKRNLSDVIREIEQVRQDGYALDLDEHTEGISAVGTAFNGPDGYIYALSLPVPTGRFVGKQADLITHIKKATANIRAFFETSTLQLQTKESGL